MNKFIKQVLSLTLAGALFASSSAFAETVKVKYSGTAKAGSLEGFMVVASDADVDNLHEDDIYFTEILEADKDGKLSVTVPLENIMVDEGTNKISNYKVVSSIEMTEEVLGNRYNFDLFTVRPVEENGILYVPIEETFDIIGQETVEYTYNAGTKTYKGDANNGDFTIVMGNDTVEVDWVDVELPGILKEINGVNMMPAYAIKYLLKTGNIGYDNKSIILEDGVQAEFPSREHDIKKIVKELPDPVRVVIPNDVFMGYMSSNEEEHISLSTKYEVIDGVNTQVRQVETTYDKFGNIPAMNEIHAICWQHANSDSFYKNEIGLLSFKARATRITDESGIAKVGVLYQAPSYHNAINEVINLTGEWQQFYLPAYNAYYDYPKNEGSRVVFTVGGSPMTIQIADFSVVSYGINNEIKDKLLTKPEIDGYKGIEENHVWRQEAWNRIEKYRKEDINVEVIDENGQPVRDANVAVKMTDNEFMFGAALCESETLDEYIDLATVRGQTLDGFMNNEMNTGVAADMLKADGVVATDAKSGIKMINEFLSRNKRTRGHTLFWDGDNIMPFNRAKQMTYQEIYDKTMEYVRPLAYTFKGKLTHWDVLNEPHDSNYTRRKYNTTRLYTDIFKEVKKIDPDVKLYVNETGIEGRPNKDFPDRVPNFLNIVKQMQTEGAPIDGIGIQAHCSTYYYPQGFYHQLDECSQIVDEVAVTEYDFQNVDETYAPNHLEDTLLATFSHPKASAFIVWGIEDSMHWRWTDDAPFFNRDWTSKPAYDTWKRLVDGEFATNATIKTDANGKATVRAFRGDYEIICSYDGKSGVVKLGNTVDGGSNVRFTVGNTIGGIASNAPREQVEPIKFNNMTDAKKELDSIEHPYYKSVILDHNFKGSESTDIVINGGVLNENTSYTNGETWGSLSGTNGLLYGNNWGSTIIHSKGGSTTGDIRRRASGTERYAETELHHETMFYTLNADVSGMFEISAGVSTSNFDDVNLADIVYDDGKYFVKATDGHSIELEKDKFYTLDTAIVGNKVEYKIETADGVVAEYTCMANNPISTQSITDVCYLLNANCGEGDIFMLHNSRLFEYKDGEFIKLNKTDYETYLFEESMIDFDVSKIEYAGTSLSFAPEDWKHIGPTSTTESFDYKDYGQYFGAIAHKNKVGDHNIVKGFESINDGESIELTFDGYFGVKSWWMDITGEGGIAIGSHDKSVMLDVAMLKYRQFNDSTASPFDIWLLDKNKSGNPAYKYRAGYDSIFVDERTDITLNLTPSGNGNMYDATISIKPKYGEEEITANYPSVFTAEDVKKIDTLFISSNVSNSGSAYAGQMMFGVKDIKLRRYGSTMYQGGEASLGNGEEAALGILYDNLSNAYRATTVIVAAFKDEKMTYCEVKEYTINPGGGGIGFDIEASIDDADYYKVFMLDDLGSIRPLKEEDIINVKND